MMSSESIRVCHKERAMPLHDHFRGLLGTHRHWTAFHNAWATYLSEDLNERLLPGYFAEPNVHFDIEIDVAAWEEADHVGNAPTNGWRPTPPQRTLPFVLATDIVEVLIYHHEG